MNKTRTLAEELREVSDNVVDHHHDETIAAIVREAIAMAKASAKRGARSCQTYHSALTIPDVKTAVVKQLKEHGFGTGINKDHAYSEHANKTMMCLTLSW